MCVTLTSSKSYFIAAQPRPDDAIHNPARRLRNSLCWRRCVLPECHLPHQVHSVHLHFPCGIFALRSLHLRGVTKAARLHHESKFQGIRAELRGRELRWT